MSVLCFVISCLEPLQLCCRYAACGWDTEPHAKNAERPDSRLVTLLNAAPRSKGSMFTRPEASAQCRTHETRAPGLPCSLKLLDTGSIDEIDADSKHLPSIRLPACLNQTSGRKYEQFTPLGALHTLRTSFLGRTSLSLGHTFVEALCMGFVTIVTPLRRGCSLRHSGGAEANPFQRSSVLLCPGLECGLGDPTCHWRPVVPGSRPPPQSSTLDTLPGIWKFPRAETLPCLNH